MLTDYLATKQMRKYFRDVFPQQPLTRDFDLTWVDVEQGGIYPAGAFAPGHLYIIPQNTARKSRDEFDRYNAPVLVHDPEGDSTGIMLSMGSYSVNGFGFWTSSPDSAHDLAARRASLRPQRVSAKQRTEQLEAALRARLEEAGIDHSDI